MPTPAGDQDTEDLCTRHDRAFRHAYPAKRLFVPQVQAEGHIHVGSFQHAVADHQLVAAGLFAVGAFFGGLEAEFDCARQFLALLMKHSCNG